MLNTKGENILSLILILTIMIRLIAVGWSIVLLRQIRDWRMGFLTIMLGLMALRPMLTLWESHKSWDLLITGNLTEFLGLIVSIMAFRQSSDNPQAGSLSYQMKIDRYQNHLMQNNNQIV